MFGGRKESLKTSNLFRKLKDPIGKYYNVFIKNDQAVKYPGEPLKTLAALVFQVGKNGFLFFGDIVQFVHYDAFYAKTDPCSCLEW